LTHGGTIFAAEFSPDGQYVATASRDLSARVWNAETGDPVLAPLHHCGSVSGVKFTPDGRQVITQSPDMLHVWDLWSGITPPFQFAVPFVIDYVDCDSSTLRVAAAGHRLSFSEGWAQVRDGKSGKPVTPNLPHHRRVTQAALSPNGGRFLVTLCDDSLLRVWNLATGQKTCELKPFTSGQPRFAAFSPDGGWLVAAGADHNARRGMRPRGVGRPQSGTWIA
jgi:WD40 repeat protein